MNLKNFTAHSVDLKSLGILKEKDFNNHSEHKTKNSSENGRNKGETSKYKGINKKIKF